MTPTRITKKPHIEPGTRRGITLITCDDGVTYIGSELAKIRGMRWPTLRERLRRQDWRRKDILAARQVTGRKEEQ